VDHLELIGSFGFILGGLLLLYPIFYWLRYINYYVKERDGLSFWMAIAFYLFFMEYLRGMPLRLSWR